MVIDDVFRVERKSSRKRLFLTLPIPPSVNSMYTLRKQLTSKATKFIRAARALINESVEEQFWSVPDKHEWMYVDMVFYFPDRKIRDASNCLKILLDCLQGAVIVNDYTALPRIQSVEYDKGDPRVEVMVSYQTKNNREKGLKMTSV